jgi:beta-lactam-binding protein with PASTA domain
LKTLKQILTKPFLINLLIAIGILAFLLLIMDKTLKVYTRHGQSLEVPDLIGKKLDKAEGILNSCDLEYKILDSAYRADLPPNTIIDQTPKSGTKVKEGRTIFITLNSFNPPMVEIPDLVGKSSYKYAKMQLESYGLVVAEPVYKPSPYVNALLEILANGKPVGKNAKLPKGSTITLVVGQGILDQEVNIPYLIGLSYEAAIAKLTNDFSLSLGVVIVDDGVTDTLGAVVYRQNPDFGRGRKLKVGEEIDIFIANTLPSNIIIDSENYNVGKADSVIVE